MASLWQIFLTFSKIGAFTIGGGYAMLPVIKSEIIKKGWMDEEDFTDIVTLAQTAPGLLAVNISIFTGYRLRGYKGSIIATLGSILPSFLIILAIAMLFTGFQDNPTVIRIFKGIRPVVVALIVVPMLEMARKTNRQWWTWALSGATLIAVSFLQVSPVYILLSIIVIAAALSGWREGQQKKQRKVQNRKDEVEKAEVERAKVKKAEEERAEVEKAEVEKAEVERAEEERADMEDMGKGGER